MAEIRKFPHHLIREIFEQPEALRRTIEPRVSLAEGVVRLDEIHISREELRALRRINIVASGTSRHAGMTGQFMMQELAAVPVDVDYASEFEYRNPMIGRGELSIFITQSGETADTTASQREARKKGSRTIAISNVEGSTIAREADGFIYTNAGPEISIASTKAFTAQMACLFLFALYLGEIKENVSQESRAALHSANFLRCLRKRKLFSRRPIRSKSWPSFTTASTISCSLAVPFTIRLPWTALSSLKKFLTFTPKAIPQEKPSTGRMR